MKLHQLTITEAHKHLTEGVITATDLTSAYFSRIEEVEPKVKAFLTLTKDQAIAQAARVDERIKKGLEIGPLEGIPFAMKDNILIAGTRTTAASKILDNYIAAYDATVSKKLEDAGAVVVGKTNMDEFAMGSSTENSAYGRTNNPWDESRVPGGSSGGSAAAVAADECVFAIGSDTGGSIRQPASLCGVVGLKPTYGSVSRYGVMAMASSLDQIGPFAKTAEDAAIIFDAIKGPDVKDSSSTNASALPTTSRIHDDIKGMKIGIPQEYFIEGMDPGVDARVKEAIEVLKNLGAQMVPISMPHTKYALSVYYVIMPAEVSANLARFDGIRYGMRNNEGKDLLETYMLSREEGFGAEARRRIMLGTYVLAAGYYDAYYKQAQKVRALVKQDFDRALTQVDCLITPTSPIPAFKAGAKSSDPLTMYLADIFTVSCNIAGVPGLSVPCGFVEEEEGKKLPVGFQLLGRYFDESTLLRVGHQYQKATNWHTERALD